MTRFGWWQHKTTTTTTTIASLLIKNRKCFEIIFFFRINVVFKVWKGLYFLNCPRGSLIRIPIRPYCPSGHCELNAEGRPPSNALGWKSSPWRILHSATKLPASLSSLEEFAQQSDTPKYQIPRCHPHSERLGPVPIRVWGMGSFGRLVFFIVWKHHQWFFRLSMPWE